MIRRNITRGLSRNLVGVAGVFILAACSNAAREPEGSTSNVPEALLATACDMTGGNLTLTLVAGEVGYIGRTAGCTVEPCVFANAVSTGGAICRVASTGKTITVTHTGPVGVEKMVVDYSAGLFASATTSTPLVSVALDTGSKLMVVAPNAGSNMALGATGLDANTLAARTPARVDIGIGAGVDVLFNGGTGADVFTGDVNGWASAAILPKGWDTAANIATAVGAAFPAALTANGGAGDDILAGGAGANTLLGGAGNDTFLEGANFRAETLNGGDGIDTVDYGVRTLPVGVSVGANAGLSTVALGASGGSGYTVGEVLTVGGGGGGQVTVASLGMSALTLGSAGGSGYVMGEVLTLAGGSAGTATVTGTGIATATVAAGGTGYVVGEVLTVAGGTGGTVTVATTAGSPIQSVVLGGSGGTGYVVGEVLTIAGGASGTATVTSVSGGVITGLSLTTAGTGYHAATSAATTADLAGTGATVTITNTGVVATVTTTTAGSSTTWPSVGNATTSNLAGTGATITVSSASVAAVALTTAGSGYSASADHATTSNLAGTGALITVGPLSGVASVTVTKPGSGYAAAVGQSTKSNLAGSGALITVSTAVAADDGDLAAAEGDTVMANVEIVKGGAGNDWLTASAITTTDVVLVGNAGNDTLTGGSGNDDLCGGAGDDTFLENAGNDNLVGGAGIDTADYSAGTGVIACLNAADQVTGKPCATQNGATGEKDVVNATLAKVCPRATLTIDVGGVATPAVAVPTTMQGGAMAVDVENLTGNKTAANALYCGTLSCTLFGGSAADTLWGGAATDIIVGGGGADTVKTLGGPDLVDLTHSGAAVTQTLDCHSDAVVVLVPSTDTKAFTACSIANIP